MYICADNDSANQNRAAIFEIDSFVKIGVHLAAREVPVPQIKAVDRFSGIVMLEDLGDVHLQQVINCAASGGKKILQCYRDICDLAIRFSIDGIKGFNDAWAFQTPSYSKSLILEKECRYFMDAFAAGYLTQKQADQRNSDQQGFGHQRSAFDNFLPCFEFIADQALENAFQGLMHRDMQSRNIMVRDAQYYFIDFQSARRGPLQYDLASLIIDPYVNLDDDIRETILDYCSEEIYRLTGFDKKKFIYGYRYCAVTRNLQMLGAFSHLTMNRGKHFFEQYIPSALETLKNNLEYLDINRIRAFYQFVRKLIT